MCVCGEGVLRDLAGWREKKAISTNRSPTVVIKDELLMAIVQATASGQPLISPTDLEAIENRVGIRSKTLHVNPKVRKEERMIGSQIT